MIGLLHDQQITPNNFVDKGKEANLGANTSKEFFPGLHEIHDVYRTNLTSFVVCFNVVQLILF